MMCNGRHSPGHLVPAVGVSSVWKPRCGGPQELDPVMWNGSHFPGYLMPAVNVSSLWMPRCGGPQELDLVMWNGRHFSGTRHASCGCVVCLEAKVWRTAGALSRDVEWSSLPRDTSCQLWICRLLGSQGVKLHRSWIL